MNIDDRPPIRPSLRLWSSWLLTLLPLVGGCSQSFENNQPIQTVRAEIAPALPSGDSPDWPQWRGPLRDGVYRSGQIVESWSAAGPPEVWRQKLGQGYSGIAVAGDQLFTLFQTDAEYVVALEAQSGHTLWQFELDTVYRDGQGDGPRGTPTIFEGQVFAVGAKGKLAALRAEDGRLLWKHDLTAELGGRRPTWGYSTSPLIEKDLVIVEPGGTRGRGVVALNRSDGSLVWSAYDDGAGYSSPLAATIGGQRQILAFMARHLVSLDPARGRVLWEFPWKTSYDVNAATPIFIPPDKVFISSGYDVGATVLQLYRDNDELKIDEIWHSRVMRNHFNSSVLYRGYLYGFDNSTLKCINAANGEMMWRTRGLGRGSLLIADDELVILGERGELVLAKATPDEFQETARAQVLKGKCWTPPSLARGRLYLRNQTEIVSLDLSGSRKE